MHRFFGKGKNERQEKDPDTRWSVNCIMGLLHQLTHQDVDRILKRLRLLLEIDGCRCRLFDKRCVHLSDLGKLLYRNLRLRDLNTLSGASLSDA